MRTFDCWIFDLDGTLTEACHDFAAIKRRLGLPPDLALLEGVALAPVADRPLLLDAICRWEQELAEAARPSPGAADLLSVIQERGHDLGILTRNTRETAIVTLRAAGLSRFFDPERVIGRDEARPKPDPEGVHVLLSAFRCGPARAALVGDNGMDMAASRAAGVFSVGFDVRRSGALDPAADLVVDHLATLVPLCAPARGAQVVGGHLRSWDRGSAGGA